MERWSFAQSFEVAFRLNYGPDETTSVTVEAPNTVEPPGGSCPTTVPERTLCDRTRRTTTGRPRWFRSVCAVRSDIPTTFSATTRLVPTVLGGVVVQDACGPQSFGTTCVVPLPHAPRSSTDACANAATVRLMVCLAVRTERGSPEWAEPAGSTAHRT